MAKKRPRARLVIGEYGTPESARATARAEFLAVVVALLPDVLATLQAEVLPVYVAIRSGLECYRVPGVMDAKRAEYQEQHGVVYAALANSPEDPSDWATVSCAHVWGDVALYPDLLPLRSEIEAWSERWHLEAEWVYQVALHTVGTWYRFPQVRDVPAFFGPGSGWCSAGSIPFCFEHAGWDATFSARGEAAAAIREAFELTLKDYLDATEARMAAADDFERPKEYRSLEQHLQWLVLYQVQGLNFSQVGRRVHAGARTVTDEVKEAADLIGLTLRPAQVGAPKGPRGR